MTFPIEIQPLVSDRWNDFAGLFGERGACAGCWCMWWRLARKDWEAGKGAGNRAKMRALTASGETPGLLGYLDGQPASWVSLGPRSAFPRLDRSRNFAPVDDREVWSLVCLFVDRQYRRQGLASAMIEAAAGYARERGAQLLEAYPVDSPKEQYADAFAYTGLMKMYERLGFEEVARRSATRPVVRLGL